MLPPGRGIPPIVGDLWRRSRKDNPEDTLIEAWTGKAGGKFGNVRTGSDGLQLAAAAGKKKSGRKNKLRNFYPIGGGGLGYIPVGIALNKAKAVPSSKMNFHFYNANYFNKISGNSRFVMKLPE